MAMTTVNGVPSCYALPFRLEIKTANVLPPALAAAANMQVREDRQLWLDLTRGTNLALGKPFQFIPAPDYRLTTDPGDATDLTDGKLTLGGQLRSIHAASYTRLYNADLLAAIQESVVGFEPPLKGLLQLGLVNLWGLEMLTRIVAERHAPIALRSVPASPGTIPVAFVGRGSPPLSARFPVEEPPGVCPLSPFLVTRVLEMPPRFPLAAASARPHRSHTTLG